MDIEKIGKYIKELRTKNNLTQEELASKLYVTNKAVSRWENGKSLPEIETLYLLSKELDVSVNEILECSESNKEKVNQYFKNKKMKKIIIDIIFGIIIFMIPILFLYTGCYTSVVIYIANVLKDINVSQQQIKQAGDMTKEFISNFTLGEFLIPWLLLFISYIGYKLNKKIFIYISFTIIIITCLINFFLPETQLGLGIIGMIVLILDVIIIIFKNKNVE